MKHILYKPVVNPYDSISHNSFISAMEGINPSTLPPNVS